jgi:hypothetical protein
MSKLLFSRKMTTLHVSQTELCGTVLTSSTIQRRKFLVCQCLFTLLLRTSGLSHERRTPRRASATFPTILVQPYLDAWPSLTRVAKVEDARIPKIMPVQAILFAEATLSSLVSQAGSARFFSSACPLTVAWRLVDIRGLFYNKYCTTIKLSP